MRGQDRIRLGEAHERAVAARLVEQGWTVQPWGQGVMQEDIRTSMFHQPHTVFWRWIPDLIAIRGSRVVLVDPKTEKNHATGNHALELDAWSAHQIMAPLGLPIVYVWADFTCNTPDRVRPHRVVYPKADGISIRDGSQTPFVLVKKSDQHPFEQWFGVARESRGA